MKTFIEIFSIKNLKDGRIIFVSNQSECSTPWLFTAVLHLVLRNTDFYRSVPLSVRVECYQEKSNEFIEIHPYIKLTNNSEGLLNYTEKIIEHFDKNPLLTRMQVDLIKIKVFPG